MKPRSEKQQERIREYLLESEKGNCINNGILNDKEIKELAEKENMIQPFVDHQVEKDVMSYGLGSYGIDLRIGNEFEIFSDVANFPVDPKDFDKDALVHKESDDSVIIPPNSFALGYTIERISMPDNLMGVCMGKSSYARCGVVANVTPIEPSWEGFIVVELSNTSPLPAKVYTGEGIVQLIFFRGQRPSMTYAEKESKYQNQGKEVQTSKVV